MPISGAGTSQNESIHAIPDSHVHSLPDIYTSANARLGPYAPTLPDVHPLANVHARASTHVYTAAYIRAVPHADLHSLPNVHAKASADLDP